MQTIYDYMKPLQEGQVTNNNPIESISLIAEADIGFGKPVQRGAKSNTMKLITTDGIPVGVTGLNLSKSIKYKQPGSLIEKSDIGGVVREGYVAVVVKDSVKAGDKAYAIPDTGEFTNVSTNNIALGNSTFERDAVGGDITEIRVKC